MTIRSNLLLTVALFLILAMYTSGYSLDKFVSFRCPSIRFQSTTRATSNVNFVSHPSGIQAASGGLDIPSSPDTDNRPSLTKRYLTSMKLRPLLTKSATSLIGFVIADIIAQTFFSQLKFDWLRTFRLGAVGALLHGPSGHFFYRYLNSTFPNNTQSSVLAKVFIDQLLWMPLFSILFCQANGILAGLSPNLILYATKGLLRPLVLTSWAVWPLAHYANFQWVPKERRLLFINVVQILYNVLIIRIIH